jgi:hypothetical protein
MEKVVLPTSPFRPAIARPLITECGPRCYTISDEPRCPVTSAGALTDCFASSETASPNCFADSANRSNLRGPPANGVVVQRARQVSNLRFVERWRLGRGGAAASSDARAAATAA